MELQHPQQAHGLEHLRYEHLQAALQLDEETADFRVDLSVLRPAAGQMEEIRSDRYVKLPAFLQIPITGAPGSGFAFAHVLQNGVNCKKMCFSLFCRLEM